MLEKYFLRLATLDRIRGSWIGPAIESYVGWLAENRYAPRAVCARVPTLMHFGTYAQRRGAKSRARAARRTRRAGSIPYARLGRLRTAVCHHR